MFGRVRYIIIYVFLLLGNNSYSQSITGTWEGLMGDQFLQLNIIQEGDQLCGYTYDYVLNDPRSFCRTYFKGVYDRELGEFHLTGTSFVINSGSHVLMRLRLWREEGDAKNILRGTEGALSRFFGLQTSQSVWLKKKGPNPTKLPGNLTTCDPEYPITREPVIEKNSPPPVNRPAPRPVPVKPAPEKPPVKPTPAKPTPVKPTPVKPAPVKPEPVKPAPVKPAPVPVKPDTIKKLPVPTPVIRNQAPDLLQKMSNRKNTPISRLQVNTKSITLSVYDNGTVDGDTVSILYNGKLLVNKQRISTKALVINIELDDNAQLHEITLFAENLGSIPPNTALIVVNAGDKRYELFSSASLQENAVLVFEYKPK